MYYNTLNKNKSVFHNDTQKRERGTGGNPLSKNKQTNNNKKRKPKQTKPKNPANK